MVKRAVVAEGDGLEGADLLVKPVVQKSTSPAVSRRVDVNRFMVGAAFWSKKQLKKVKV